MILTNTEIKTLFIQHRFCIEKTEQSLPSESLTIKVKDHVFTIVLKKHEIYVFVDYTDISIFYTSPKNFDNCMKLISFLEDFKA